MRRPEFSALSGGALAMVGARLLGATLIAMLIALVAAPRVPAQEDAPNRLIRDGGFGLVVSNIQYGMTESAATGTPACPRGAAESFADIYLRNHPDARPTDNEGQRRLQRVLIREAATAADGKNLCVYPTAAGDPGFRTVEGNLRVYGIDLDGQKSRQRGRPAPGTCAHDDFTGMDGHDGVDNQYFRAMGCVRGYQPGGIATEERREMLSGAWSILIALTHVDSLRNDDDVDVSFFAGADPLQLGADRSVLANATYAAVQDPRFRATTRGRIVNGVLTTIPVNVRFKFSANGEFYERPLHGARLAVTIAPNGVSEGFLSGYSPVDELYQNQIAFNGNTFVAVSAANAIGYTCNGLHAAFLRLADGDRDPASGRCTSLSTQYRISAVPAFVLTDR